MIFFFFYTSNLIFIAKQSPLLHEIDGLKQNHDFLQCTLERKPNSITSHGFKLNVTTFVFDEGVNDFWASCILICKLSSKNLGSKLKGTTFYKNG